MSHLNTPYPPSEQERQQLVARAASYKSWAVTERQSCDLEMLLNGSFAPLQGFMPEADYQAVLSDMRLATGEIFPIPIVLDVSEDFAGSIDEGETIVLEDAEGVPLALLEVASRWTPDKDHEAQSVFGTTSLAHPAVHYLQTQAGAIYLGGKLTGINPPTHYDFKSLRHTPAELRQLFAEQGWERIVAFQTRNPMHRAHVELVQRAAERIDGGAIINPVVGMTKPGDVDHYSRVRCYQRVLEGLDPKQFGLSLLPLAMRMGGPREALWHALIRRNCGFTHLIVGRDHAGPGKDENGQDFYGPYDAQELVQQHAKEIGIEMVPFKMMVYLPDSDSYAPMDEIAGGQKTLSLSGTEFRGLLERGESVPAWFSMPEVVEELRRTYPPRAQQGVVIFFTGLSGSGKSTIANTLRVRLMELGGRRVSLLDGDKVRRMLSSELGFSREHRDLNILRIAYVANKIATNGGVAICAPIAPYAETRARVRQLIAGGAGFFEVYLSTPLEVCEQRDRKGLYALARAGKIKGFTGIDDPYEPPQSPELEFNTALISAEDAAGKILQVLKKNGYLAD